MSQSKPRKGFRAKVARTLDKALSAVQSATPSLKTSTKPGSSTQTSLGLPPLTGSDSEPNQDLPAQAPPQAPLRITSVASISLEHESGARSEVVWDGLYTTLRGLHQTTVPFPPLQSAVGGVMSCLSVIGESYRIKNEYMSMAVELEMISGMLREHLKTSGSTRMSESIARTSRLVQEQVDLIGSKQDRGRTVRLFESEKDQEVILECYREIQALFRQLQLDASLSIWSIVNKQLANTRIEGLKPAMLAAHDSSLSMEINRRACTENTRTNVLYDLHSWASDHDSPNVYWMNGLAGTGKTTIAFTFAEALKKRNQLAASFFCTRTSAECRDVTRIVPTIVYQLARYSIPFQSTLCRVLEDNPELGTRRISTQFESLLKQPLLEAEAAIPKALVVVIDALDECAASKGVEIVLDMLLRSAGGLPLKFFVTSRPAPNIRDRIENLSDGSRIISVLHEIERSFVRADIELYLKEELPSLSRFEVESIADRSGGLFIYAATMVRYIQMGEAIGDFGEHLSAMLSVGSTSRGEGKNFEINRLYMAVLLEADMKMRETGTKELMRHVLWTVVCAREPLRIDTLVLLADINLKKARTILGQLYSVLYQDKQRGVISTIHASFTDFMLDLSSSAAFFCDTRQHNWLLTRQCFITMREQLRFNICGLESSHRADEQVPRLEERVDEAISPTLSYVCQYWGDHLNQACCSNGLYDLLDQFLSEHLLFWMEVMNLKRWMRAGVQAMLEAKHWLAINHPSSELLGLAEDARAFVASFAANTICQSTPHIYLSALPMTYRSSGVYRRYCRQTCRLIEPKGRGVERRYETAITSWKFSSFVHSVAYSRDGAYIAIGGRSGSITVKDAYDGTSIGGLFEGHTGPVHSIAFSPDCTRIVSGSEDCTIRIWDVQDGTLSGGPFCGHLKGVTSVAFSPDSTYIASGSRDGTARIWNVQGGTLVTTFTGHKTAIASLAISPDGTRVASGSGDRTIRVWHASGGTPVGGVLEGHTQLVSSVAFSPDGSRIVSGSDDRTVRIWDVQGSSQIGAPFRGHTGWVTSVAFSPDGISVVSGSQDQTIRRWRAKTGEPIGMPFDGHTERIASVAYSPDGTRIASGAFDRTVRIWNVQVAALDANTSQGHRRSALSVAFSPDGKTIASGSSDNLIRLWSALDGSLISPPFTGHTHSVYSVTFSPDGARIISGSSDFTIRVWNVSDGSLIFPPLEGHNHWVLAVAISPNGKLIVSGSRDRTIRVWNMHDGTHIGTVLSGHTGGINSIAFSPDGMFLASGSSDKTVRIWNIQSKSEAGPPLNGHRDDVTSVMFSPDGTHIVSGSADSTIRVWDAENGSPVGAPLVGHTDQVSVIKVSPDGTRIVSGSVDRTIRLWSMEDSTGTAIFHGHTDEINSVVFSPDGNRLVSGSRDASIRVWDVTAEPSIDTWNVSSSGWVMGRNSELLFWLPPDLVGCLPTPHNQWSIGLSGPIYVDYSDCLLGDDWQQCYVSE